MPRTSLHDHAQQMCAHNGVATLATDRIRAVIYAEPIPAGATIEFIALVPDGRFRFGRLSILKDAPTGHPAVIPHPGPRDADALADALMSVIEANEARGPVREVDPPFEIGRWRPWEPRGGSTASLFVGRARDAVMPWLPRVPVAEASAFPDAWASAFAGHVTPEQVDAAEAFSGIRAFDPPAFDEACGLTVAGQRCRDFARNNAVIALACLSNPAIRSLVAAGAPLAEVIGALPQGEPALRPAYGDRKARRNAVARISGFLAEDLGHEPVADLVLSALEALPPEWAPRSDAEMAAFAKLCRGATHSYALRLPGGVAPDWWRIPFAGSGGRWAAYADRVLHAGWGQQGKTWGHADLLLKVCAERRAFIVDDLLIPLSHAYDAPNLTALSARPGLWMGGLKPTGRTALHAFAHHALTEGMALPAVADQGRRHNVAVDDIREVCRRYPVPKAGPEDLDPFEAAFGGEPPPPGVTYFFAMPRDYDHAASGAIDAMVAAWRPVMPRRLRGLSARDFAAALDAEAARFGATLPNAI